MTAGGNHHGLLMRNNLGGAEMVTPTEEPARTMTTKGHQSLLVPYYGHGTARPTSEPIGTVRTRDGWSLVDAEQVVDDCGFRMLEPYEVAAAMAFPVGYIDTELTKKDQVKLAGNAVTPPVMTWLMGRVLQALEGGVMGTCRWCLRPATPDRLDCAGVRRAPDAAPDAGLRARPPRRLRRPARRRRPLPRPVRVGTVSRAAATATPTTSTPARCTPSCTGRGPRSSPPR